MILVLDNYDSFTYNLVQYLGELGAEVRVSMNDGIELEEIVQLNPAKIVTNDGRGDRGVFELVWGKEKRYKLKSEADLHFRINVSIFVFSALCRCPSSTVSPAVRQPCTGRAQIALSFGLTLAAPSVSPYRLRLYHQSFVVCTSPH